MIKKTKTVTLNYVDYMLLHQSRDEQTKYLKTDVNIIKVISIN